MCWPSINPKSIKIVRKLRDRYELSDPDEAEQ
jgi:hypothetical protein